MTANQSLTENFAHCQRRLRRISQTISDQFFSALLNRETEVLFALYLKFLKRNLGVSELALQIRNLCTLVEVFQKVKAADVLALLILEKELLTFRTKLFALTAAPATLPLKNPIEPNSPFKDQRNSVTNVFQKQLLDLIKERGEVDYYELYEILQKPNHRTLRRNLAYLLSSGLILKEKTGKMVFYKVSG